MAEWISSFEGEYEGGRRLEVSVFGIAGALNAKAAGLVFSLLIFVLVLLEIFFSKAEEWAHENETNELFNKLKKELTMLGIVSFLTFIYTSATNITCGEYYEAFEMSHIVILFIAFAFILQASFLLQFAFKEGDRFIYSQRQRPIDLIEQYEQMLEEGTTDEGKRIIWFFVHAPFWVPTFPTFRQNIENKLIEKVFKYQHKLDEDFRFAHYMSKLFSKYISELGEVSPTSWFMLAILILLNIARIALFDQSYEGLVCPDFNSHKNDAAETGGDDHGSSGMEDDDEEAATKLVDWLISPHLLVLSGARQSRMLSRMLGGDSSEGDEEGGGESACAEDGETHPVCYEFLFQYSIVISFMLLLLMLIIYVAASYYHSQMLKEALHQVGLEWKEEQGRAAYVEVLKIMADQEEEMLERISAKSRLSSVLNSPEKGRRDSANPGGGLSRRESALVRRFSRRNSSFPRPGGPQINSMQPAVKGGGGRGKERKSSVFSIPSPIHHQGGLSNKISAAAKSALEGKVVLEEGEEEEEEDEEDKDEEKGGVDSEKDKKGKEQEQELKALPRSSAISVLSSTDTTEHEDEVIAGFQQDLEGKNSGEIKDNKHASNSPSAATTGADTGTKSSITTINEAFAKVAKFISEKVYGKESEGKLDRIFLFKSPDLFFFCVEYSLLLQCLYIAVWATQLVPLLAESPGKYTSSVGWGFGLTIPMVANVFIIQLILSRSVMLKAVCGVHPHVLGEVNEEALEEEDCLNTLCETVRKRLESETNDGASAVLSESHINNQDMIPPSSGGGHRGRRYSQLSSKQITTLYKVHLKKTFDQYDDDGSGAIGKKEFRQMLDDLGIYLSFKSFKILWLALDDDMSGEVTWDELFVILFPELKAEMKAELAIVNKLRQALGTRMKEKGLSTKEQKLDYMKAEFDKFDADGSGTIDMFEMEDLVKHYVPSLDIKQSRQLFSSIDIDGEGGVEWKEFKDIFFGIDEAVSRSKINWF